MINVKEMNIKKTEDMKLAHNMYKNSHSYHILYQSEDKLEELLAPQFIYSHDSCVGMIHQELEEQPYYHVFIDDNIVDVWTADILVDIVMHLFHENKMQIVGVKSINPTKKDMKFNKKVRKYYNDTLQQQQKQFELIESLQYLNDLKNMLKDGKTIYDLNIKLQSDKVKRRVK